MVAASAVILVDNILKRLVIVIVLMCFAAMLSDGYLGGDEGVVHAVVRLFHNDQGMSPATFFATARDANTYLQHHLFWSLIQIAVTSVLAVVTDFLDITFSEELHNWLLAYPLALAALVSLPVSYRVLRRLGRPPELALLCIGLFFFGGSVIGLLTGGFIECYMLFAVAMRMLLLTPRPGEQVPGVLLALVDFTLIAAKSYSLIFLLALLPGTFARLGRKERTVYLVIVLSACVLWFLAKSSIPVGERGPVWTVYKSALSPGLSVGLWLTHVGWAVFSFSFGLLWTTPVVLLLFGHARRAIGSENIQKLLGIAGLMFVFTLYPFWHGATGMPGQRYVLPFLLVLLPEMASGLRFLIERSKWMLVGVFACIVLFLPAVDFRNTLTELYASKSAQTAPIIRFGNENFPMLDWSFHPGVFAWRVVLAKWNKNAAMSSALYGGPSLDPAEIAPMTGISRVIFAAKSSTVTDLRLLPVRQLFSGRLAEFLALVRGAVITLLLAVLGNAVLRIWRKRSGDAVSSARL